MRGGLATALSVLAGVGIALGSCAPAAGGQIPEDFQVLMERGPCFGSCPIFTMTVSADGSVVYDGIRFVEVEGRQTATLSETQVQAIFEAVRAADFFDLDDRYEAQASDLPSITLEVTADGRNQTVYHYGLACEADFDPAPQALCELEALLEQIPASQGWITGG